MSGEGQGDNTRTFIFIDRVDEVEPPGPWSRRPKCIPEMPPEKVEKRHRNKEPRASQNDPKVASKMDVKITANLGCLGDPKMT